MSTPTYRRKKGKESFISGKDPSDYVPWKKDTNEFYLYYQDFLDGWNEAKAAYEKECAYK